MGLEQIRQLVLGPDANVLPAERATQVSLEPFDRSRRDRAWRALWSDWQRLAASAPPFLTPEFVSLQLPLVPPGDALVATVRRGGRLVGLLPVIVRGSNLIPLRSEHSQHYDHLGDRAVMGELWRALCLDQRWDVMCLKDVPEDSPLAGSLAAVAEREGCNVYVRPSRGSPVFSLRGFEERLKPKFRTNVRRCARKLGDFEYERWTSFSSAAFDDGVRIEGLAWKREAGSAIDNDLSVEHSYRALARLMARRGQLSLSFITHRGRRIAFLFALEHGGTVYAMKIGYDPEFANVSAGHLVVWRAAADAERRGLEQLDFLGKQDEWKLKWTDEARRYVVVLAYRSSVRGTLEHALREVLKPSAPRGLLDLIQKPSDPE